MAGARKTVFMSYSHRDRKWADELLKFLAPWIRNNRLTLWDDSKIVPGASWEQEIHDAIKEASVAILLVSSDFLASDYISKRELPAILRKAEQKQIRVAWVALSSSAVRESALWKYQALNDPSRPLDGMTRPKRNKAFAEIASAIANVVTMGTLASGLQIIDETTEPLEAALDRRQERHGRQFGVQAQYDPDQTQISFQGSYAKITVDDLQLLPEEDREFIADLEDSLRRNYARWSAVRKGLGEAGGALDEEIEGQLTRIGKIMCRDLNSILDFLRKMHKGELEDHYGRYRYICQRLGAA